MAGMRCGLVSSLYVSVTVHGRTMSAYEKRKAGLLNGNVNCDTLEPEEVRTWGGGAANALTKRHSRATILHGMLLATGSIILEQSLIW
jgi:hypothetical protein